MKQSSFFDTFDIQQLGLEPTPYDLVTSNSDVSKAVAKLPRVQCVLDIETFGPGTWKEKKALDPWENTPRLIQIGNKDHATIFDLATVTDIDPIIRYITDGNIRKIIHNAKFELKNFKKHFGVWISNVVCTFLAEHTIKAGRKWDDHGKIWLAGLGPLATKYLGVNIDKSFGKSDWSGELSTEQLQYAADDCQVPDLIWQRQSALISEMELDWVAQLEFDTAPVTAMMELNGIKLDQSRWMDNIEENQAIKYELNEQVQKLLEPVRGRDLFGQPEINLGSSKQVLQALRGLGVELEATNVTELNNVFDEHPVIDLIQKYRKVYKQISSYGMNFIECVHNKTGRIHPEFKQNQTRTGRYSAKNPAIQTIPKKSSMRKSWIPEEGNLFIGSDYSQIELRMAAHIYQDEKMLQVYRDGGDIHCTTGSSLAGREVVKGDPMRQAAKPVNFGLIYGQRAPSLRIVARDSYGVYMTLAQAAGYIAAYFRDYSGIREGHKEIKDYMRKQGREIVVKTLTGRRRYLQKSDKGFDPFTE